MSLRNWNEFTGKFLEQIGDGLSCELDGSLAFEQSTDWRDKTVAGRIRPAYLTLDTP